MIRRLLLVSALCILPIQSQEIAAVVNLGDWSHRLAFHSLGAIFGSRLAETECVATEVPLPKILCGVSVTLTTKDGNEATAPLFFVSPDQINFQVPASQWWTEGEDANRSQAGLAEVRVRAAPSGASTEIGIDVNQEPALLEYSTPSGQAPVLLHAYGALVTVENPATWNETLSAYGTGFGIYSRDGNSEAGEGPWPTTFPRDGYAAPLDRLVEMYPGRILQVTGGSETAPTAELYVVPDFVGLAPGLVGVNQINFKLSRLLSERPEPHIVVEGALNGRTKAYRVPMSEAAKAEWEAEKPVPPPATGGGNQFFVAPDGASTGDGSFTNAWDLKTALAHPAAVKPGDTIWIRGGTYSGLFRSLLQGTAASPIIVRNYNNERATIDTGRNTGGAGLEVHGGDTWYWGLEIMSSNQNRVTGARGSGGGANLGLVDGVDTFGTRNKFINLIVHDTRQGYGFWEYGIDNEIYGNLIYYNGWSGGDRGHGHAIYSQNRTGIKTIEDNIQFKGYAMGIRAIGSKAAAAKHYRIKGNISFESGALYGNKWANLAIAVGSGAEDILVENTYTYHDTSKDDGSSWLGWTGEGPQKDVIARNNYWIGGESAVDVKWWDNVTYENNVSFTTTGSQVFLETQPDQPTSKYIWRNNRYFGADRFRWQSADYTFVNWKAATGLDLEGSTFTTARPSGTEVFVRPNKYEPGRAHIAVYNWALQDTVSADVSAVLMPGDSYEVRDVQNYYNAPVLTGVYDGTPLVLPMNLTAVAAPSGEARVAPVHTGKEFNAFVLKKR